MSYSRFGLVAFLAAVMAHDDALPINPALGVPGFPDCVQPVEVRGSVEESAQNRSSTLM